MTITNEFLKQNPAISVEKHVQGGDDNYRDLLDNASDAILTCDLGDVVTLWNKSAERIFGWKGDEIIGKKLSQLMVPSSLQAEAEQIVHDVASGRTINEIYTVRLHMDRITRINVILTAFPLRDAKQNIIGVSYIIRDLTEYKQVENALKETEARLQAVSKSATDAVILADFNGNIISWNRGAQTIFQYSEEDVIGKPLTMLIPKRHIASHEKGFKIMTSTGEFHTIGKKTEIYGLKKDGSEIPLELSPASWNTGMKTFYCSVILDLSERKKAEELRVKNNRLERLADLKKTEEIRLENTRFTLANKAEVDFLASISHDLRTPLNSIIGFSELLRHKVHGDLNKKQEQYVDNVLESSRYLLEYINNLDLRMIESGKIQLVIEKMSAPETINEAITLFKEIAEKQNIILKKDLDPQLDLIEADRQRFKQILFNLLSNAVKLSKKEGGTVTIKATKAKDMAIISVSDTGIGFMGEDLRKLFNKDSRPGLAISKKLMELQGGTLTAESRYGEGSTFTLQLPLVAKK